MGGAYLFLGALGLHDGKVTGPNILFFLMWIGIFQLNYDLQRRHFPALFTLPVTPRQIGQAWWLVSVGLPALLLAVTSGAGLVVLNVLNNFNNESFPVGLYIENCMVNTSYLAILYFIIIFLPNKLPQNPREYFEAIGFGVILGIYTVGEMIRLPKIGPSSPETIVFIAVGVSFTIAGWVFARPLALRRWGFKQGVPRTKRKRISRQSFQKFGGIPFLLAAKIAQTLLIAVAINAVMGIIIAVQEPLHFDFLAIVNTSVLPFVIVLQIVWVLRQLRLLRMLPLSTGQMAIVLVAFPVILSLALAVFLTALAIPTEGATKGIEILVTCLVSGAILTLAVPLAAIFGLNQLGLFIIYVLGLTGVLIFQQFIMTRISMPWVILSSCLLILGSYFLTKLGLIFGNPYRITDLWGIGWSQQR
jgi:hypothetical protein